MLTLSIGLLVIAAMLGLALLLAFFGKKPIPLGAAILHGMFAEAAAIFVFVKAYQAAFQGILGVVFLLLIVAALGGISLVFLYHLQGKKLPAGMVFVHTGVGVVAFLLLVYKVFARA